MNIKQQVQLIIDSQLFDQKFYASELGLCTGITSAFTNVEDALEHYLTVGWKEMLNPHPLFNQSYYLTQNLDVRQALMNPLLHFVMFGMNENRPPGDWFDPEIYLSYYPEILLLGENAFRHYLSIGAAQDRITCCHFDHAFYLARYGDVAAANLDPLWHYETYGKNEGRMGSHRTWTRPSNPLICLKPTDFYGRRFTPGKVRQHRVFWGSRLTTEFDVKLLLKTVASYSDAKFCIPQQFCSDIYQINTELANLEIITPATDDDLFSEASILVHATAGSPISELLLAAISAEVLILTPDCGEISKLLDPFAASFLPGDLTSEKLNHAITYAFRNEDVRQKKVTRARQILASWHETPQVKG